MPPDTTQLQKLERLLIERREHFITTNENKSAEQACEEVCSFMSNEKLLSHYDLLIDIVHQAILIGERISPENRRQLLYLLDQPDNPLETKDENPDDL